MRESLGDGIKNARGNRALGTIAQAAGISSQYLCDIERGRRIPPPATIVRLADVLSQDVETWLWRWVEETMGLELADRVRSAVQGWALSAYGLKP